jgi:hypothetical protein
MPIRQAAVPWIQGYDFGVGADLMSGSPMGQVVKSTPSGTASAGGGTVLFKVRRVRTSTELEQSLGLDVDASYGSALFGAGVKARLDFVKSAKVQTSGLFMTISTTVSLQFLSIDAPELTDNAARLVDRPDIFETRFGNMFVRGIARGGLFVAVLRIETESVEDAQSISTELSGSYGFFSAEAQAKFRDTMARFRVSLSSDVYHEGGPINLAINDPADPTEPLKRANEFLTSFQTQPDSVSVPYSVTLAPIAIAEGPLPPNAADIQKAEDVLAFCAKRRSVAFDQLNLLSYIVDNPTRFDFSVGATLEEIRDASAAAQSDLELIAECASNAINDPQNAKFPAAFAEQMNEVFPKTKMPKAMPTPRPTPPDFEGVWDNVLTDDAGNVLGTSTWTMKKMGANRYNASEEGPPPIGNAVGVAIRTDLNVDLNWRATAPGDSTTGRYRWTVEPSFTRAEGNASTDDGRTAVSRMIKRP